MAGDDPTAPTERLDLLDSGAPTDGRPVRRRTGRRAVVAVVAASALVAAGAFGAALASGPDGFDGFGPAASATSPEAESDPAPRADVEQFRHHGHGPKLRFRHGLGLGGAPLRGELVVPDPDGDGFRTVVVQRGEVTAASGSSLTVRSEDGFSATYRLTEDTGYLGGVDGASSLQDGDAVHVAGVRQGGALRAVHVADVSRLRERFERFGELRDRMRDQTRDRPGDQLPEDAPSRT